LPPHPFYDAIKFGELIGIFPEGRLELKPNRREIAPFHHGAAIASRDHIPVVPILMNGMEAVMPHSTAHLRERIHIAPIAIVIDESIVPTELRRKDCIRQAILDLRNDFPGIASQMRSPQKDCTNADVRPRNA